MCVIKSKNKPTSVKSCKYSLYFAEIIVIWCGVDD